MEVHLHNVIFRALGWASFSINAISIVVLIYSTPKDMSNILKPMILGRVFDSTLAMLSGVIVNGYSLFPVKGMAYSGPVIYFPEIISNICFYIYVCSPISMIQCIIYQYYVIFRTICGKNYSTTALKFFKLISLSPIVIIVMCAYPFYLMMVPDKEFREYAIHNYPEIGAYLPQFDRAFGFIEPNRDFVTTFIAINLLAQASLWIGLLFFYVHKSFSTLNTLRKMMSTSKYRNYRSTLTILVAQALIPLIVCFIPGFLIAFSFFFGRFFNFEVEMILHQLACAWILIYTSGTPIYYIFKFYKFPYQLSCHKASKIVVNPTIITQGGSNKKSAVSVLPLTRH